jgi:hypothetical protein
MRTPGILTVTPTASLVGTTNKEIRMGTIEILFLAAIALWVIVNALVLAILWR